MTENTPSPAATGRRWLKEITSGSVTIKDLAIREACSTRRVTMLLSLAFGASESSHENGSNSGAILLYPGSATPSVQQPPSREPGNSSC
jgi:hypothetical protein